ncbi:MAG: DUF429 domain-containing protein [Actinomycetota bacterium]|nr:DUF429 domain-containing protein [Actinomycetota bacterium]
MLFLGIDLAWGEATTRGPANETGLAAITSEGTVLDAGWARGVADTVAWVQRVASGEPDVLVAVDAPLIVTNPSGQRLCEKQVGQRYGRWQVSANSTNLNSPGQAGVRLLQQLEEAGFHYNDGWTGPPVAGHHIFECYPYTTLVGVDELGYDVERPRYKARKPRTLSTAAWRPVRAAACDELLRRLSRLSEADPALRLDSHPVTAPLLAEPSPTSDDGLYKHREDLIDAVLCAWTASLWHRHGLARCQVLGDPSRDGRAPTILAPCRPEQRRSAQCPDRPHLVGETGNWWPADATKPVSTEQRRQAARVDAAYLEWARNRDDVDRLRHLRDAIDDALEAVSSF